MSQNLLGVNDANAAVPPPVCLPSSLANISSGFPVDLLSAALQQQQQQPQPFPQISQSRPQRAVQATAEAINDQFGQQAFAVDLVGHAPGAAPFQPRNSSVIVQPTSGNGSSHANNGNNIQNNAGGIVNGGAIWHQQLNESEQRGTSNGNNGIGRSATDNAAAEQGRHPKRGRRKRSRIDEEREVEEEDVEVVDGEEERAKVPKLEENEMKLMRPEVVLGVNRFISPFSEEAKIPLPHELNELSAHGTTVWKRNERERQRVRCVNEGYAQLRSQLPLTEQDRRLSKVGTLRMAIAYIHHLEQLIAHGHGHQLECQCFNAANYMSDGGSSAENTPSPQN